MSSEQAAQLRQQGIAAAKAGQKAQARDLLRQSLRLDPRSESAWIWLMSVAADARERLLYLHKLIELNPENEVALKTLQSLNMTREQLAAQLTATNAPSSPATTSTNITPTSSPTQTIAPTAPATPTPAPQPQAPGVPIVDPRQLGQYGAQIDSIVREYLAPLPDNIQWTHKTSGRAGERDGLVLRAYVIAGAALAAAALIVVVGLLLFSGGGGAQAVAERFTPVPTATWTPTPGATPTASVVPTQPDPTLTPTLLPTGVQGANAPYELPPATDVYPAVRGRALGDAVAFINQGQAVIAIPTLEAERGAARNTFDPNLYYFDALARLQLRDPEGALETLRLGERDQQQLDPGNTTGKALIDLGFAQVYLYQAQQVELEGTRQAADELYALAEERATSARTGDQNLALGHVLVAQLFVRAGDFPNALRVLNEGLAAPRLNGDLNLIIAIGETYLAQGQVLTAEGILDRAALAYGEAGYQAFVALYIDPALESANSLRIQVALAQGQPGTAVLYAQDFLFYAPGSVLAYMLLGEARAAEGNFTLALDAYSQAAVVGDDHPLIVEVLLERAALYTRMGEYELALNDLSRAYSILPRNDIRYLRMEAAYSVGDRANFRLALEDAEALSTIFASDPARQAGALLIQARILVDSATPDDTDDLANAVTILTRLRDEAALTTVQRVTVNEYLARAYYALASYDPALNAINAALAADPNASRHYLRGQIYEALDEPALARRDYEWVLTLTTLYPGFALPAAERERLTALVTAPLAADDAG